jgi:hypothetical protein
MNDFNWLERRFAEFIVLPVLVWDRIRLFYIAFSESKQPIASWKFAKYMSDDLMTYMQERGWYK